MKQLISIIAALIIIISSGVTAYKEYKDSKEPDIKMTAEEGALSVYFIDVGQGDCEYIVFPDGKNMLIDSGEKEYSSKLIKKLHSFDVDTINYLIITHPHTDHMGGMSDVIKNFYTDAIYMPKASADTETFEELLDTIREWKESVHTATAGLTFHTDEKNGVTAEFLAPVGTEYDELNDYSAVVKITYKDSSFLFTGDAEKYSENEMLGNSRKKLDCDVLKVGHHGSRYSSSKGFLRAVSPQYAVIECGKDNAYGHPHTQTLDKLQKAKVEIYRTDKDSDILFVTHGDGIYKIKTNCFGK
jgi:beta-lactamase superfamily II metal-dependent hydrolase